MSSMIISHHHANVLGVGVEVGVVVAGEVAAEVVANHLPRVVASLLLHDHHQDPRSHPRCPAVPDGLCDPGHSVSLRMSWCLPQTFGWDRHSKAHELVRLKQQMVAGAGADSQREPHVREPQTLLWRWREHSAVLQVSSRHSRHDRIRRV